MKNLINKKFNRLTPIKYIKSGKWLCKCDCGNMTIQRTNSITSGIIKSCGCYNREVAKKLNTTHGMHKTRFYKTWGNMINRCRDNGSYESRWHGAKGIKICDSWEKFENFRDDMYKLYLQHVKEFGEKNTSIDRINGNGNYTLENCRWATCKEQSNNSANNRVIHFNNKTMTMKQWSEYTGIKYGTLLARLDRYKWGVERALTNIL